MGCDIHLYAEKRVHGKWICINPLVWNYSYTDRELRSLDVGRSYGLFGFLAGVREEQPAGFLKGKGFPKDASEVVSDIYQRWGDNAHTPSYLTLQELEDQFKGKIIHSGYMQKKQLKELQESIKSGKPNWELLYPYCGGTTEKNYVKFKLEQPIESAFGWFKQKIMDDVLKRATFWEGNNHDDVRIVFWFDN